MSSAPFTRQKVLNCQQANARNMAAAEAGGGGGGGGRQVGGKHKNKNRKGREEAAARGQENEGNKNKTLGQRERAQPEQARKIEKEQKKTIEEQKVKTEEQGKKTEQKEKAENEGEKKIERKAQPDEKEKVPLLQREKEEKKGQKELNAKAEKEEPKQEEKDTEHGQKHEVKQQQQQQQQSNHRSGRDNQYNRQGDRWHNRGRDWKDGMGRYKYGNRRYNNYNQFYRPFISAEPLSARRFQFNNPQAGHFPNVEWNSYPDMGYGSCAGVKHFSEAYADQVPAAWPGSYQYQQDRRNTRFTQNLDSRCNKREKNEVKNSTTDKEEEDKDADNDEQQQEEDNLKLPDISRPPPAVSYDTEGLGVVLGQLDIQADPASLCVFGEQQMTGAVGTAEPSNYDEVPSCIVGQNGGGKPVYRYDPKANTYAYINTPLSQEMQPTGGWQQQQPTAVCVPQQFGQYQPAAWDNGGLYKEAVPGGVYPPALHQPTAYNSNSLYQPSPPQQGNMSMVCGPGPNGWSVVYLPPGAGVFNNLPLYPVRGVGDQGVVGGAVGGQDPLQGQAQGMPPAAPCGQVGIQQGPPGGEPMMNAAYQLEAVVAAEASSQFDGTVQMANGQVRSPAAFPLPVTTDNMPLHQNFVGKPGPEGVMVEPYYHNGQLFCMPQLPYNPNVTQPVYYSHHLANTGSGAEMVWGGQRPADVQHFSAEVNTASEK